jgi:phosphoribosylanthranilate isomerase
MVEMTSEERTVIDKVKEALAPQVDAALLNFMRVMAKTVSNVNAAKERATRTVIQLHSNQEKERAQALDALPDDLDALDKAWTDAIEMLGRQIGERDEQIRRLIDQLAEARKR